MVTVRQCKLLNKSNVHTFRILIIFSTALRRPLLNTEPQYLYLNQKRLHREAALRRRRNQRIAAGRDRWIAVDETGHETDLLQNLDVIPLATMLRLRRQLFPDEQHDEQQVQTDLLADVPTNDTNESVSVQEEFEESEISGVESIEN
jgi:hypothetical protein